MKTCSVRSKRRDQYQSDHRETHDKTRPFNIFVSPVFLQTLFLIAYNVFQSLQPLQTIYFKIFKKKKWFVPNLW